MVSHPIAVARIRPFAVALLIVLAPGLLASDAAAQSCPGSDLVSGLRRPMGIAASNRGNLIVSETGTFTAHSGRISIVGLDGTRRTLIDGLPSGINDVAEPGGPAGLIVRGRTIYVVLGVGDSVLPAPIPTRHLPNPAVSSPIYSSVLAIHVSAHVEQTTSGFTFSTGDQQTLAAGGRVILSNGGGDSIEIELIADFPDYVPDPLPANLALVRGSNPFDIAIRADTLFVTDGGRNLIWAVDLESRTYSVLTTFPPIPNPVPGFGPVVEAVPTGIEYVNGRLLATLFRGVPFPAGTSTVVEIDPETGVYLPLIGGLKTAIDVTHLPGTDSYLVLQHSSGGAPFFGGPGVVLGFASPSSAPQLLADCLVRPTTMWFDAKSGNLHVAEMLSGRIVTFAFGF